MNANESRNPALNAPSSGERRIFRSRTAVWEAGCIAIGSIWSHKLRSALTLLGVIIGVASVVAVGGAIDGLGSYVSTRLSSTFGSNAFTLAKIARINLSYEEWDKLNKKHKKIYTDDLREVTRRCDGCAAIVPMMQRRDDAKVGDQTFFDANVSGVNSDLAKIQELTIAEGNFLTPYDVDHSRAIAVIGADIHRDLFGPIDVIGKSLKIGGDTFTIAGVE